METHLVIEELKKQFSADLLYIYLKKEGFKEEELFPPFFNQIGMERVYSTLEVAEMFDMSDNNLRYQMKIMRKLGYINSFKAGRNYRFNYINIYRMYLVTMILNISGRNTSDIANILNGKVPTSVDEESVSATVERKRENKQNVHNSLSLNEVEIQIIEKQMTIYELHSKLNESNRCYLQLDQKFNSMLLELELINKLNESLKQVNKKWFFKQNESDISTASAESNHQLRTTKNQLSTLHNDISEYEKRLALELYDIKKLFEVKKRLIFKG